jgi:hypothetical protein
MDHPAGDRGAKLIARNRELLAVAAEAREWAGEAIVRAKHAVRNTMRTRVAREQSRQHPAAVPIYQERRD